MATNYEQLKEAGVIKSDYHERDEVAAAALDQSEVDKLIEIVLKIRATYPDDAPSTVDII